MNEKKRHIAMLIDCDNASPYAIKGILKELSKYGEVIVRQAYGNWNNPQLGPWMERLLEHSIKPIQQFDYTRGKNATDIAMVIDAMDLMYTRELDGFALVTSDSDFTPLAQRLMSNGLTVYGFGEKKTPKAFINSCSQFIFTENLEKEEKQSKSRTKEVVKKKKAKKAATETESKIDAVLEDEEFIDLLLTGLRKTEGADGWVNVSDLGQYLSNNSAFSPVNYGYEKLGALLRNIPFLESKFENNNSIMYVRQK
jgi:uncharacterized protein (TIGR00288 family)